MSPNKDLYDRIVDLCSDVIPKFRIAYKDESRFMRLLGRLLFFTPGFMTRFTTTIGSTVYFPSRAWVTEDRDGAAGVLAHELVHLWDHKRMGIWFSISYLYPQIFVALALFGVLGLIWSGFYALLAALVFLWPIPSEYRMKHELRGYSMNIAMAYWTRGHVDEGHLAFIESMFTGMAYYRMEPDIDTVRDAVDKIVHELQEGTFFKREHSEPYQYVYAILDACGQVKNDLPSSS